MNKNNNSKKCFSSSSSKSSTDLRSQKSIKIKQSKSTTTTTLLFGSHRIKNETPRPTIQWSDVKTGFKHFKIKRWNSIGSWVENNDE